MWDVEQRRDFEVAARMPSAERTWEIRVPSVMRVGRDERDGID